MFEWFTKPKKIGALEKEVRHLDDELKKKTKLLKESDDELKSLKYRYKILFDHVEYTPFFEKVPFNLLFEHHAKEVTKFHEDDFVQQNSKMDLKVPEHRIAVFYDIELDKKGLFLDYVCQDIEKAILRHIKNEGIPVFIEKFKEANAKWY